MAVDSRALTLVLMLVIAERRERERYQKELCVQDNIRCRHLCACTSNSHECGYWSHLSYPIA